MAAKDILIPFLTIVFFLSTCSKKEDRETLRYAGEKSFYNSGPGTSYSNQYLDTLTIERRGNVYILPAESFPWDSSFEMILDPIGGYSYQRGTNYSMSFSLRSDTIEYLKYYRLSAGTYSTINFQGTRIR